MSRFLFFTIHFLIVIFRLLKECFIHIFQQALFSHLREPNKNTGFPLNVTCYLAKLFLL